MMADQYTSLRDMFDGGGMGTSGDEFQGGGLLSMIGNALFQPMGYRERQRAMAETRPQARPAGLLDMQPMPAPTPAPTPQPNPMASGMTPANAYVAPQQYSTSGMNPANAYVPAQPMQYSGRGTVGMPMPQFAQTPQEQEVIEYLRSVGVINY